MNTKQAYLLGAYLTDGCVWTNKNGWKQFTLEVIDRDFAEKVSNCLDEISNKESIIYTRVTGKPTREYYKAYSGDQLICNWLQRVTENKTIIPAQIFEADINCKREFIAGAMDGDGFIGKNYSGWQTASIGFAITDLWVYQFIDLLHSLGVQTGKVLIETKNRNKPLHRFSINKKTFLKAGLYFSINRKNERLNQLRSSETTREDS